MRRQHLLDRAGRQAMTGGVDDVVSPRHHPDIAVRVDEPGVGGLVVAGIFGEIGLLEALVGLPQRRQRTGRQRQLDYEGPATPRPPPAPTAPDPHTVPTRPPTPPP